MGSFYVFTSLFIAQLSGMITSPCLTWSSPMLLKLNSTDDNPLERRITSAENSWLAALATLGVCLGAILCGILTTKIGRKPIFIVATIPTLVFNLVMALSTNIWFFYISRLFTGVSLGLVFPILPMYTGEVADVKHRGILLSFITVFVTLGVLLPYCLGPICSFFWFHIILACLPCIFIPLFYFYAPESPHFLINRDYSKARDILRKLRPENEIDEYIEEIRKTAEYVPEGSFSDLFKNRGVKKAIIIGWGLGNFMTLSGNGLIFAYSQTIFEEGGNAISPELCPIILGLAQLIACSTIATITDKFPRKFLLIVSFTGIAVTSIPLGIYYFLIEHGTDLKSYSYIPLVFLLLNVIAYHSGIGPVGGAMLGEVFPLAVKGKAISILILYNLSFAFVITLLFNTVKESLGMGIIFWFFSVSSFAAIIFTKTIVVETKGRTLEEIQRRLAK